MPSVPRIVVVDPSHEIARIVHGALGLLSRQYILIEVPGPDDALAEVAHSTVDLLVTAYSLVGEMHGIELAQRINHESLGTPVIVLGGPGDPVLDSAALKDSPFQYFVRPVAELFLRGLRIALDGPAAVADEVSPAPSGVDPGPVPSIDIDGLRDVIVPLMRDVGAMGVILSDRTGRVLIDEGATGYIDRERLAAIMGPSFARAAEVSPLVGGDAWTMQYYDGERLDVFGLAIGLHYFMGLIFEGSNRGAFGAVTMFGRRAADQMIQMLGEVAYQTQRVEPLPEPKAAAPAPEAKKPAAAKAPVAKKAAAPVEAPPEPAPLEVIHGFDPEVLFGQDVDETLADSLFDPDKLSDLAATMVSEGEQRVDYDEAVNMGILDE